MHFLDPTNDYAFKKIFGNEQRKDILISFLNSILQLSDDEQIVNVTLLNPFQAPHIQGAKETILDVRCQDQKGHYYIVEMQVIPEAFFDKRVLYYASKAYASQLNQAETYKKLKPVIFLGILNFTFSQDTRAISTHVLHNVRTQDNLIKDIRFTFAELPKFDKQENALKTIEDKWLYFLKYAKTLKAIPSVIQEAAIREAFEVLDRENWDEDTLALYEYRAIEKQKAANQVRHSYDKGKKQGEQIGLEKGEQIGLEKGREKGREEEKLALAKKLLMAEHPPASVAELTDLSLETVHSLLPKQ